MRKIHDLININMINIVSLYTLQTIEFLAKDLLVRFFVR